jgi:FdhE protein
MPHVPVAVANPNGVNEIAERRWAAILAERPDLEPALQLQRRLLGLVIELAAAVAAGKLPRLSLPPKYLAAKLNRGVPVLSGEPIPVPSASLTPALLRLCQQLATGAAAEPAMHIDDIISSGRLDAGSLLTASLNRDQESIREGSVHRGLAPDLVWLVAELAVSPFVHALQQALFANGEVASALNTWSHGYCPACGSWPALAEVVGGHRTLRCSFCAAAWELNSYGCIYCGDGGDAFITAAPNLDRKDRRVELCRSCGGYLKTADVPALSPFPLLAVADLETMDLDMAAMEHGYARPALKTFGRR